MLVMNWSYRYCIFGVRNKYFVRNGLRDIQMFYDKNSAIKHEADILFSHHFYQGRSFICTKMGRHFVTRIRFC